jgi:hypothetical protein
VNNAVFPLLSCTLLVLTSLASIADTGLAQQIAQPCQPPQPDEYLLLVLSQTSESQKQIQRTLPADTPYTFCQYLDDTVARIAGFRRIEDAQAWGRYVKEIVGLSAFVVRPTSTQSSSNTLAYNPQPLGDGYAVLIDYFNQPEIAAQVRQLLGRDIGLVSYGQRPYLLAIHTSSQRKANSTLRQLSDRGFWSMVVDSRRVTLLKPSVSF